MVMHVEKYTIVVYTIKSQLNPAVSFGTKNACVEDFDRNISTVVRVVTHMLENG